MNKHLEGIIILTGSGSRAKLVFRRSDYGKEQNKGEKSS
jgi:hypothetical protein